MAILDIRNKLHSKTLFTDLTKELDPYKEKETISKVFLVDASPDNNVKILIKYPGKKVKKRNGRIPWANLYDFLVVPNYKGKDMDTRKLQWRNLMKDFYENKIKSKKFWELLENIYKNNEFDYKKVPKLDGMDPTLFFLLLKWMWIQEDINYKYSSKDIPDCPSEYRNETKGGSPTKGAGRGKFYAALLLVKYHGFTPHEVGRIIP